MEPAEKANELMAGRKNLRAASRFNVDVDAHLLLVAHGATLPCRIVDLSLSGCRLRTVERFPARGMVRVEVAFKVRGLAFRFCGTTQWTDGHNLVGIRFEEVPARRKEEFLEAISEVEAEDAAKRAAEKEAAAQLAANQPETLEADVAPAPEQGERPAQAVAGQELTVLRNSSILPWSWKPQRVSTAETAARSLKGGLAAPGAAESDPIRQNPAEQASADAPKQSESQRVEARLGGPSLVKSSKRERREQLREGVDTSAVIYLINVASRLTGRILDLSLGGCRIRTDEFFPVGIYTRVETEFRLEGLPFRLGGVIQAIHDRHNVGIRFLDMSSRKREQVEQLIEEIEELKRTGNKE
jgi:c-di-GMP-binding flagellar brake protein YcgR